MMVPPSDEPSLPKSSRPLISTSWRPCLVPRPMVSPTLTPCFSARARLTATIVPASRGAGALVVDDAVELGRGVAETSVGAPPVSTGSPSTTTTPMACRPPSAIWTPSTCGPCRPGRRQRLVGGLERLAERRLRHDDDVDVLVGGLVDVLEAGAQLVGEHVGAADHGHAEQHGQDGEGRAQLVLEEVAEGDADHEPGASAPSR